MSEHYKQKPRETQNYNPHLAGPEPKSSNQSDAFRDAENDQEDDQDVASITYSQAVKNCQDQMLELHIKIQHLSPEEQEAYITQARKECEEYLSKYRNPEDQSNEDNQEFPELPLTQDQAKFLQFQRLQGQVSGLGPIDLAFQGDFVNGMKEGYQLDETQGLAQAQEAFQQQQAALLMQQLGQGLNPEDLMAQYQVQQKLLMSQQMGNQLRNFARQWFKKMNQRQKNKLHTKARQYLDLFVKDQKKLQKQRGSPITNTSSLLDPSAQMLMEQQDLDFEYSADPQKYIDEIEQSLKKHKDLYQNFQRFIQKVFDDVELEQVITNFITANPEIHRIFLDCSMKYCICEQNEDEKNGELFGNEIFNLIMPYAQKFDPRLLVLIPKKTLDRFQIEYEDDDFHIRGWTQLETSASRSSGSEESDGDQSGSGSEESNSSNEPDITTNSQAIGDSDEEGRYGSEGSQDQSQLDVDASHNLEPYKLKKGLKHRGSDQAMGGSSMIPQSALTGKNKSLITQMNFAYPNQKNINKHDIKPLDNLFRGLKDDKDWINFCKILFLYFEGVFSLTEFCKLYEEKYSNKLKQEIKDEIEKLLPTRDMNRRTQSNLLKPWNDTENQTFEKIPDSSYYRIENGFPIPTCTRKMMEEIYHRNLNDQYLSLAIGTENFKFKFRNTNEEQIYKTEDKMYELDTQIDNIQKSQAIINQQCDFFESLSEADQNKYKFPCQLLNPLRFYWDQKFRKSINDQYFKEGKLLRQKDMASLKKTFNDKLDFLRNQKISCIGELKDQFRKNFTKSLDHKSFQYKDFMKKYLQKQNHINKIKHITEGNQQKRRFKENEVSLLYGSGQQSAKSNYKFFNTFGKDFSGSFNQKRLDVLAETPDSPIDMNFMKEISDETRFQVQAKCPQARYLFNDTRAFEITLKLIIQYIKLTTYTTTSADKNNLMYALKFIMVKFMMIDNFDQIDRDSDLIQPVSLEMVDILMNSLVYYHKKYTGELGHMQEVFPHQDPSNMQSPLKLKVLQENNQSNNKSSQNNKNANSQESFSKGGSSIKSNSAKSTPSLSKYKDKFKPIRVTHSKELPNTNDKETLEQSLLSDLFIPKYVQKIDEPEEHQYKLLFGPLNIYMFMTFFYSIYERVLKAEELVRSKVEQDFIDDFSQKEWSLKFKSRMNSLIDERFQYLIKSILTVMTQSNILDTNKFEDVARELLGNEAYMLFQVDKLINHCQKQLIQFFTDNSCKAAKQLFDEFEAKEIKNEALYLENFYKVSNQSSLAILQQANNAKAAAATSAVGAAAANKDIMNPSMNQQAFRFLYSPKSQIMTVHFIVLNPFLMTDQKTKKEQPLGPNSQIPVAMGDINSQEKLDFLQNITAKDYSVQFESDADGKTTHRYNVNRMSEFSSTIFLNRNLTKMKRIRKANHKIEQQNGLITRFVPMVQQLTYDQNTEDALVITRLNQQKTTLQKRKFAEIAQDLKFQGMAKNILQKRLKTINKQTGELDIKFEDQLYLHNYLKSEQVDLTMNPESNSDQQIKPAEGKKVSTRKQASSRKNTPNKLEASEH